MLILSNSMPKSASTLMARLTIELIGQTHHLRGQHALHKAIREKRIPGRGNFVDRIDNTTLDLLVSIGKTEGPLVVKTHHPLTPRMRKLIADGTVKATFSHRDPRDVILSAIDHRNRTLKQGAKVAFYHFSSVRAGLPTALEWCDISADWVESGLPVLLFRYTDLVSNLEPEVRRLCAHLELDYDPTLIEKIRSEEKGTRKILRSQLNTGALSRYKDEMSPGDILLCNRKLGPFIRRLGYELEATPSTGISGFFSSLLGR